MSEERMRRYTNLASAVHILKHGCLTLLDPARWDDQNDAYFLRHYKDQVGAKSLVALCFAKAIERYHHWRVFSYGTDGVCLEFDEQLLVSAIRQCPGMIERSVRYMTLNEAKAVPPTLDELPFIKREPFRDEGEYRIIYADKEGSVNSKACPIPITCIKKIILSPWMPADLVGSLQGLLRALAPEHPMTIYQSRLIQYEEWKELASLVRSRTTLR